MVVPTAAKASVPTLRPAQPSTTCLCIVQATTDSVTRCMQNGLHEALRLIPRLVGACIAMCACQVLSLMNGT